MNDVKYKGLVATLTREILGGKFTPLGAFPSERALAMRFGVSRQTIRRVMRELKRTGLVYSRQGKGTELTRVGVNLRESVGLILTGERRTEIVREIREELTRLAGRMGLTLLFGDASALDARSGAQAALRLAKKFVKEKVSGVILQPVEFLPDADGVNAQIAAIFAAARIPVVLIDCDIVSEPARSAYDVVGIDNFQAGRALAAHLAAAGVREALFLAQTNYPPTIAERLRGVRSVLPCTAGDQDVVLTNLEASSIGRAFLQREKPQAIVCQNDIAAVNALAACRLMRWRVPEDVLLAGFDDVAYAPLLEPALTSVRQPCKHIAGRAFDLLFSRIGKSRTPAEYVRMAAELIVRGSTTRP
ncbi:MAG: substrate-binding domain-containing protein [Kiritimatiellia bacterium]